MTNQEPVAWAVGNPAMATNTRAVSVFTARKWAAVHAKHSNRSETSVLPLYLSPQPTLTDEEREAVKMAALYMYCPVLSNLLERLGGER